MAAVNRMAAADPSASAVAARRNSRKSNTAKAKPIPRIGPISGEMSMAPITTAGEDSSNPSRAMPADINVINRYRGDQTASSSTLRITST
jgi:hypothetical protein